MKKGEVVGSSRDYKRGAIMGLTVAEAFILLSFVLLLLFTWWQVDTEERSIRLAEELGEITDEQKARIIAGLSDGTFEMAQTLREAGLRAQDMTAIADIERYSRFMREEDLKRLMNGAVELAPGTRLKLSEVVEVTPETKLRASLEEMLRSDDAVIQASQRLADAAAAENSLVDMLNSKLGDQIRAAGGEIATDGTITLPQRVLFEPGSASIRDPAFLRSFCGPWVRTLQASGLDISELKIEGHASSEGQPRQTREQAYLYNLSLSQRRAQNALEICLGGLRDSEVLDWARGRLSAAGYSSARLVRDAEGNEDRDASRRVMFAMDMNRERLLDDIREDLSAGGSVREQDHDATKTISSPDGKGEITTGQVEGGVGIPRILDGDTLAIGERRWRLSGIDAPEMNQVCKNLENLDYPCGEAARMALTEIIGEKEISCEELEKDRYGRSVGVCRVDGIDLGEAMVKMGMAVPYLKYSTAYEGQGIAARAEKRGLWSGAFDMPNEFRKLN